MPTKDYIIPAYGSSGAAVHGWLLEAQQEGMGWLASQPPGRSWEAVVQLLRGEAFGPDAASMSNVDYPKAKRIFRELVASLASFQHEGEFKVLWDNAFYDQAHLLTDLDRNWFTSTKANLAYRSGIQTALAKGTSYFVETWDPFYWGPWKGEVVLEAFDPADVTFVQLPRDHDIQKAYMVILRYELPINLARRMYRRVNPGFAHSLQPDQQSPSWVQKGLQKVQQFISPALRVAGRTRQDSGGAFPTVNIYHGYIVDDAINLTPEPVTMGAYGTNWSYTVPALGDPMPTGLRNPQTGEPFTRPAKEEDCRLFPLRRLCIWSSTGVAYDGSSPWWHGQVPVARLAFNDLPWEALGGSAISDVRSMEQGIVALMRATEDSAAARLDPPALYDDTVVSEAWAKSFNPRLAGVRAAAPLMQGDPIKFPVAPQYYDVPQWITSHIESQEARMDYLTGVKDVAAIAKAKQIPGADTIEKLLEMAGPLVQDMVRALEAPLTELGQWRGALYFQFYNAARIVNTVGPDSFDPEEWNWIPETLKQQALNRYKHLPPAQREQAARTGTFQFTPEMLLAQGTMQTQEQRTEQAFKLISQFRYEVTESGVNEIHRMTTKLFYLQLMKEGFPVSPWTFARIAKIPNFGPPPEGTNTEMERWIAWQHMKIELQGELQKESAVAQAEAQTAAMGVMAEGGMMGGAPGGPGGEPGNIPDIPGMEGTSRGRPQSYRNPPRMVRKDQGARTTITTA